MASFTDIFPILLQSPGRRVPAAEIARRLGVSTRTVRNYVTSANRHYGCVVRSAHAGYLLDETAYERARDSPRTGGPGERRRRLLRELVAAEAPLDVYDLAEALHVSDSTLEADLTRARALAATFSLRIVRQRELVRLEGEEMDRRRLMRRLLAEAAASSHQFIDLQQIAHLLGEPALLEFKARMVDTLESARLIVNDRTADELVAHVGVMVDRVRHGHPVDWLSSEARREALATVSRSLAGLVEEVFAVSLSDQEVAYLALLLLDKAAPADPADEALPEARALLDRRYVELVSRIIDRLNANYLVDLGDERFIGFLALHIRHLVDRASRGAVARVPVGQSVKNTHPLVHELAVFIAQQVERETGVTVAEDEIGFLSFHVGGRLQSMNEDDETVSIVLVVPRYYDVHLTLRQMVDTTVAGIGRVDHVVTSRQEAATYTDADLMVTTTPISAPVEVPVIRTGPLPSPEDLARIRELAEGVAASKTRFRVAAWLTEVVEPALFMRIEGGGCRDQAVARLVEVLRREEAVGAGFIDQVMERERLSSTAFASGAAIPHSMEMTASRTAIALCTAKEPVDWDGTPVRVIAMLCLSETSRETFGDVFDALIRALVDRSRVDRLAGASTYDEVIQTMLDVL